LPFFCGEEQVDRRKREVKERRRGKRWRGLLYLLELCHTGVPAFVSEGVMNVGHAKD
jgi:hypothetical protein